MSRQRQLQKTKRRGVALTLLISLLVFGGSAVYCLRHLLDKDFTSFQMKPTEGMYSSHAVLLDWERGRVLFDRNSVSQIFPASLTKIMTAVVVLEKAEDLGEKVLISEALYSAVLTSDAATAGFVSGEKVPVIDLLYGLLLSSGAECAMALAEHVASSEEAFAYMMNDKAKELGLNATHFVNATGLHDAKHYSTVKEIAILLKYALQNETFYEIFTSSRYLCGATNRHPEGIMLQSTVFSRITSPFFEGGKILGGKTGYTPEAGQCLASLAEKSGERFILVTCGAPGDNIAPLHIADALNTYAAIKDSLLY